jgi:hypothetical protein
MIQLTQEQCEARMLKYLREFYQTDRPDWYLADDIWPLLAYVVRRTAEDVSVLTSASTRLPSSALQRQDEYRPGSG